jgi:hypothetical protein
MKPGYPSIFTHGTETERKENFETYLAFTLQNSGDLIEQDQDLTGKRKLLKDLQTNPVRARKPLVDEAAFYRNYVTLVDDPATLDRKTLLLTSIYKFARHEWVGISGAWDATPDLERAKDVTERINRYHLAEEFCHIRMFHEMFRTMNLDRVVWQPLGPVMERIYRIFPLMPGWMMDAPAFVTELMGIVFYRHVDALLDDVLSDEPEARDRIRVLLHEIMVDELAHVGQRLNFIGPIGTWFAKLMVRPLMRAFFKDIPESRLLFDVDRMIDEAISFDYSWVTSEMMARSWVPTYCKAAA